MKKKPRELREGVTEMSGEKIVNLLSEIAKKNMAEERKSPEPDKVEVAKTAAFLKDWAGKEPIQRRGSDSTFWVCGKRMFKMTFKMANALVARKQATLKGDPREGGAVMTMKRTVGTKSKLKQHNEREKAKAERAAAREKAKAERAAVKSKVKRAGGKMDNRKITVVTKDPGYKGSRQQRFALLKTGMIVDAYVAAAEKAGFPRGKAMAGLRIFEQDGYLKLAAGGTKATASSAGGGRPKPRGKRPATGAAKKATARKAPAKKATARKAPAKKATVRKAPAKKATVRKAPAKKTKAELKKGGVKGTPFEKMYPGIET